MTIEQVRRFRSQAMGSATVPRETPTEHPVFGKVIYAYSRAQAIEDGVLVDVSEVAREAGIVYPVAITRAVFEDCVAWSKSDSDRKHWPQDESGRLWDVLSMLRFAVKRGGAVIRYQLLRVPREGRGHKARLVTLKAVCGPGDTPEPCVTIMLPEED